VHDALGGRRKGRAGWGQDSLPWMVPRARGHSRVLGSRCAHQQWTVDGPWAGGRAEVKERSLYTVGIHINQALWPKHATSG
jgi:hypothetical protein